MNRRDFDAIAKAARAQLQGVGEVFCRDAEPAAVLAGFLADAIAGADGCSGFDKAKFLKACGVINGAS